MKKHLILLSLIGFFFTISKSQNLSFSGGRFHSVFLCENGNVYAFGKGTEGQIGNNSTADQNSPTQVLGVGGVGFLQDIKQVDAGSGGFTLALSECGDKVYAWGDNTEGQLGINTSTAFSTTPLEVNLPENVRFISGGNGEAYVITDNNEVLSWGGNDVGQLGQGTTTTYEPTASYVLTGPGTRLSNVKLVDGGDDFGVALLYDGTVWFWGKDARGVGGQGTDVADPGVNRSYAVQVRDMSGTGFLQNIEKITAGDRHILALSSGDTLFSWGANWARQVGNNDGATNQALPTPVLNINNSGGILRGVKSFAAGNAHSVAVLTNGNVVGWGLRRYGHLGDNVILNAGGDGSPYPVYTMNSTNSAVLANIVNVSDGDNWSFAIDDQNKVYAWGQNTEGQLGINNNTTSALPVEITLPCPVAEPQEPPFAQLGNDTTLCAPFSLTLDANNTGPGFTYEWFKDGGSAIPLATNQTHVVTSAGEYTVVITKTTDVCGTPDIETSTDNMVISQYSANFSDPGTLEFCTDAAVSVTESGSATSASNKYEWYAASSGGVSLGESTDEGSITIDISTLTTTGTTPNQVTSVWVEDVSTFTATLAAPSDITFTNPAATFGRDTERSRINFDTKLNVKLNSIDITFVSSNDNDEEIVIYESDGTEVIRVPITGFTSGTNIVTKTVDFGGVQLNVGDYYIESPGKKVQVHPNGDADALGVYSTGGKDVIEFKSIGEVGNEQTNFPLYLSWDVTVGDPFPCGRVEVSLDESCPLCTQESPVASGNTAACVGDILTLTATPNSSTTGTISYQWFKAGAPVSGATSNTYTIPSSAAAVAATYTVTVTNSDGCSSASVPSNGLVVTINAKPAPPVIGSNSPICLGEALNLTAGGESGASYSWSGPNSFTNTDEDPTIAVTTAAMAGSYTVTQTVNGCESDAATEVVTINSIPAAPTVGSNSPICLGEALNLTADGESGASYSWSGPNSFTNTDEDPTIAVTTAAMADSYTVTQTVNGCESDAATEVVTINSIPAPPTVGSNSPICIGGTLNLTATGLSGASYSWSGPNSFTSTDEDPTIAVTTSVMAGSYAVTQTVNSCESNTATEVVAINPLPTADLSNGGDICIGGNRSLSIALTGTPDYTINYTYTTPTGAVQNLSVSSTTNTGVIVATAAGTYTLTSVVDGNTCSTTGLTDSEVVDTIPSLQISPVSATCGSGIDTDFSVNFTISGGTAPYTVTRSGSSVGSVNGSGVFTETGLDGSSTNAFSYTITESSTCTAAPSYEVVRSGSQNCSCPVVGVLSGTETICDVTPRPAISLTLNLTGATNYSAVITAPDGTDIPFTGLVTGDNVLSITNIQDGTYTLKSASDEDGAMCVGSMSGTASITINPLPTADISNGGDICIGGNRSLSIALTGNPDYTINYTYAPPTGAVQNLSVSSTTNTGAIVATAAGTYTLTSVVDGNTCSTTGLTDSEVVDTIPSLQISPVSATCGSGIDTDFSVNFTISGGTAPYTVTRSGSSVGSIDGSGVFTETGLDGSSTNAFIYTITESSTCTAAPSYEVVRSGSQNCSCPVVGVLSGTESICDVTPRPAISFTLNLSGATNYSAVITAPDNTDIPFTGLVSGDNSLSISNIQNGIYTLKSVSDEGGALCVGSVSGTASITINPLPTADISNGGDICIGGNRSLSIALTGTPDYTINYSYTPPTGAVQNLSVTSTNDAGEIVATAAGTYTLVSVVDGNTCSTTGLTDSEVVDTIPSLQITPVSATCGSGIDTDFSVNFTISGGTAPYTVTRSGSSVGSVDGSGVFTETGLDGSSTNAFSYTITESSACTTALNYEVVRSGSQNCSCPVVGLLSGTVTICDVTPRPAINFTLNLSGATSYSAVITAPDNTDIPFTGLVSGDNSLSISNIQNGIYTLKSVSDEGGALCSGNNSGTALLTINSIPVAQPINNGPYCSGQSIELLANSGVMDSYTWDGPLSYTSSNENPTLNSSTTTMSGDYGLVVVKDGCTSERVITAVVVSETPALTVVNPNAVCSPLSVDISSNLVITTHTNPGSLSYYSDALFTQAISSQISNSGKYYVKSTSTTNSNCFDSEAIDVVVNQPVTPTVSLISNKPNNEVCFGDNEQVTFTASPTHGGTPSYKFEILGTNVVSTDDQSAVFVTEDVSNKVKVIMTSTASCVTSSTAVDEIDMVDITPSIVISSLKEEGCVGESIQVASQVSGSKSSGSITWYKGGISEVSNLNSEAINVRDRGANVYYAEYNNGICDAVQSNTLNVYLWDQPNININNIDEVVDVASSTNSETSVELDVIIEGIVNDSSAIEYAWNGYSIVNDKAQDARIIFPAGYENRDVYSLVVTNQNFSQCMDKVEVEVVSSLGLQIPNAFSPNGDGINDTWVIQGLAKYPGSVIQIFNRWGNRIYHEAYSEDKAWDGDNFPVGTYYYILKINDDAFEEAIRGALTITR